jgi:predicted negative regulator of RcsB-dependent stress response
MEIDKTKFNLGYLLKGDGKKDWFKALGNGWRLGVILFIIILVGFTIWKAFFEKKNTQQIHIGSGSQVTIKQNEEKKKSLVLFIEPYVDQSSNRKFGTGVRGGVRLEF